jgi:hypothetical protein
LRTRRQRLIAFLASCALVACGLLFATHALTDRGHEHEHCDLCVHLSGSAGSPAHAQAVGKPVLAVRVPPLPAPLLTATPAPTGPKLARGPPSA